MVEVFLRTCALNPMRFYLACASIIRWSDLKDCKLHVVAAQCERTREIGRFVRDGGLIQCTDRPKISVLPIENFWTTSKQFAEDLATGDIYVLGDDDHLPIDENWLCRGGDLLRAYPEFALLSGLPIQAQNGVRSMNVNPNRIGEVVDGCVGAPYFMRKGSIGRFPECEIELQDPVMCDELRRRGWRVGHALFCRYNHTGLHLGTAVKDRAIGGPVR